MPGKKHQEPEPDIVFTPAADLEAATQDAAQPRYRVLSGGIATASGTKLRGEVVTAEELGTTQRVANLLARGSIEEV